MCTSMQGKYQMLLSSQINKNVFPLRGMYLGGRGGKRGGKGGGKRGWGMLRCSNTYLQSSS